MKGLILLVLATTFASDAVLAASGPLPQAPARVESDRIERDRHRLLREALAQAEQITPDWHPDQRDCAGFVRHLWRKGVQGRSGGWVDSLGRKSHFLQASELVAYNFERVADDARSVELKTGDLLVYYQADKPPEDAWHLMVALEPPAGAPKIPLVIYHNGSRGPQAQVRKVRLTELQQSGLGVWLPTAKNPQFKGIYRWREWVGIRDKTPARFQ